MRESKVLSKLRTNKPIRMCSMGHFVPAYISHAAHFGFDAIWLDLEHRAMHSREVQSLLAFFHLFDIDCVLRPPTLEKTGLYRYLEDGATGLMIPHVSTAEKARMLVQSVKFPPLGDRGLDGAGLDSAFRLQHGPDYATVANRETFLVVQIETPEAVANIDEIAAVPGIDALFIGPADLALRLNFNRNVDYDLQTATQRVAEAAAKHGKVWGQPAFSPDHLRELIEQGARLNNYGGDFRAFHTMLESWSKEMDTVLGK